MKSIQKMLIGVASTLAGLLLLTSLLGSWYTVDQGEVAVVLRNGAVIGSEPSGLHFKLPLIDDVERISTRTEKRGYQQVLAYSRDQQSAALNITINYRMPAVNAVDIYTNYKSLDGAVDRIITPRINNESKVVFGRFVASSAVSERGRLVAEMTEAISGTLEGTGIIVESVLIENIDFSDAYEQSVEQRMLAEVEVAKLTQNLAREKVQADIVRTQASAQADAVKAKADAEAYAISARGEAEAAAINARGKALKENPDLVRLVQAEKWNGMLPTTMLPSGTVPFLDLAR